VEQLVGVYDAGVTANSPLDSQPHSGFSYDKMGRLVHETDQLGKKMYYTYYDNGLLKEKYDATASTPGTLLVTYTYNNRGQVTDKTFTDGTYEHFTYWPDGKLQTAANQDISYTYAYYDNGRLQTVTDTTNNRVVSYDEYDGLGQRKQVTVLKGGEADERVITYDYDGANRPWHVTSVAGRFTYSYDNLGRRDTLTYPMGNLQQGIGARIVSYADDIVILCRRTKSDKAMATLRHVLERLGLSLNEAKTKTVNAFQDKFDFLGFTIWMGKSRRTGNHYPHVQPSKKSLRIIKDRVTELTKRERTLKPLVEIVREVNVTVKGWIGYFHFGNCSHALEHVRGHVEERLRTHLRKRHKIKQRERGYVLFKTRTLYEKYGLYKVPTSSGWARAQALR
jgi:YD repeat-containing protein